MKYFILLLLFFPASIFACIDEPHEVEPSTELGFYSSIKEHVSMSCTNCNAINIIVPKKYKDKAFQYGSFRVFFNGQLVSSSQHESDSAYFIGIVSTEVGFSYQVTFKYGDTPFCPRYKFVYKSDFNDS